MFFSYNIHWQWNLIKCWGVFPSRVRTVWFHHSRANIQKPHIIGLHKIIYFLDRGWFMFDIYDGPNNIIWSVGWKWEPCTHIVLIMGSHNQSPWNISQETKTQRATCCTHVACFHLIFSLSSSPVFTVGGLALSVNANLVKNKNRVLVQFSQ